MAEDPYVQYAIEYADLLRTYGEGYRNLAPLAPIPYEQEIETILSIKEVKPVMAYEAGKQKPIVLAKIRDAEPLDPKSVDIWVDINVAFSLIKLIEAAEEAGYGPVTVRSSFRTNEEQTRLYKRYIEKKGAKAARPGYSRHQTGRAVDVNLPAREYFLKNASKFGWVRTVASESWHFAAVGKPDFSFANQDTPAGKALDGLRKILDIPDESIVKIISLVQYEDVRSVDRAEAIAKLNRRDMFRFGESEVLKKADHISNKSAAMSLLKLSVDSSESTSVISSVFSYDFTLGLWGDGKAVGIPDDSGDKV